LQYLACNKRPAFDRLRVCNASCQPTAVFKASNSAGLWPVNKLASAPWPLGKRQRHRERQRLGERQRLRKRQRLRERQRLGERQRLKGRQRNGERQRLRERQRLGGASAPWGASAPRGTSVTWGATILCKKRTNFKPCICIW
jgi:hypothetical protein